MNEGKRPGGLTALAVLNFVFSGWGLLGIIGMIFVIALFGAISENMDPQSRAQFEALKDIGLPVLIGLIALSAVSSVLLLISGIGYLKQKKFLGRTLGNAYAIIAIISSVASAMIFTRAAGGGFNIGSLIGFIYPVLTLILLNTTFKEDLAD